MYFKKIYLLMALSTYVSLNVSEVSTSVRIENLPVLNQWLHERTCGVHALRNAHLGLDFLRASTNEEKNRILLQMQNKNDYFMFAKKLGLNKSRLLELQGLNKEEMQCIIQKASLEEDVLIVYAEELSHDSLSNESFAGLLKESFQDKAFVIYNGGRHWISCAIKKEGGKLVRIVGMNSARYAQDDNGCMSCFKRIFVPQSVGLTDEEAINRVVCLIKDFPEKAATKKIKDDFIFTDG